MLKRDVSYVNFDDEKVTETLYFNITKSELVDLEVSYEGGMEETLKKMIKTTDSKALLALFKQLILTGYGVKSEDGRRFIKTEQLREEFSQTAAYDALFVELASSEDALVEFIKGIFPKDLSANIPDNLQTVQSPLLGPAA